MGGSRRKLKRSRQKVRVGLPKKNPNLFKPAFSLPPKLRSLAAAAGDDYNFKWDDKASVIKNYKSFGVVSNPNLLSVRSRTAHILEAQSLQAPPAQRDAPLDEFEPLDSGSDLEEDDLKSALGKQRRDGKGAPLQPLTSMQRYHIGRLVEKYGDDYQKMFMDSKLNAMQHSVATLEKLCKRYHMYKDRNPLIVS
ncbi:unnamed protein product [Linum trigynum]|uniref:Nucleolar protein 16 n=1 Tax=Linum trigynum TaxID=586398 RepID=A0AAV2FLK1_9ROSI